MEIWIPLISACIGGLIATIPVLIGLGVQIYIHLSEKRQKDREAKIQLALELRESDIKILEDTIDNYLKGLGEIRRIRVQYPDIAEVKDQLEAEFKSRIAMEHGFYTLVHVNMIADKLAYTFGEPFYSEYRTYKRTIQQCMDLMLSPPYQHEKEKELDAKIIGTAGKLHTMLQEKLISLRDTQ